MIEYILKTLQKEEYVFIERLGAFRTQLKHAVIEKNVIRPPYNEVVFSQNDSEENNFALANQISRERKCLFTEANEQIMRWVDELLAALQNNKSVTFEGFGTFMLDKKGNISFESAVVPQLNSQFEGMEPIDVRNVAAAAIESVSETEMEDDETMKVVETVEETESEPVVETETVDEPVDDEAMKDDETMKVVETVGETESEPVVETETVTETEDDESMKDDDDETMKVEEPVTEPELVGANNDSPEEDDDEEDDDEEDEEEEKKRHGLAWLWVLLLLLVALGALGFVFKDKITSYYHQWKEKKQPAEQKVVVDEPDNGNIASFEEEVEDVTPVEEEPQPEEVSEPEVYTPTVVKQSADKKYDYIRFEPGHYYVIAGSFPTESDVLRHVRQKKLDQYSPKILKQDGVKNLRVCIGVFDNEAEAEQFAKGIDSKYWVLK